MKYPITPKVKELTGSKKREFYLETANTVAPVSGWSGGSIEYHLLINFMTNEHLPLKLGDQFRTLPTQQELLPNCIMITTSVFMGKPGWPRITCRPDQEIMVKEFLGVV